MNRVTLIGNIVKDPEIRIAGSTTVCNATLVTNERYKDKTGKQVDTPSFHNLTVFGKQAEVFSQYVTKGMKLAVEGSIKYDVWEKEGVKQYRTSITVNTFEFLSRAGESNDKPAEKPRQQPARKEPDYEPDIPF